MKSSITIIFLTASFLFSAVLLRDLYPQKTRPSNRPDRKQELQTDHEKNDERKRIEIKDEKKENRGERKDHTGITVKRPERESSPPKNSSDRNERIERDDPIIHENRFDSIIEIDIVPVPFVIPIDYEPDDPYSPVRPKIKYQRPDKYDPVSSGLRDMEELDFEGALQNFNIAIERDPENYKLYYYRGLAYLNLKYYYEAIKDFDYFLIFYFYDKDGYFQRGLAKFYLEQKLGAYADFSIAAEMGHKVAGSIIKRFY